MGTVIARAAREGGGEGWHPINTTKRAVAEAQELELVPPMRSKNAGGVRRWTRESSAKFARHVKLVLIGSSTPRCPVQVRIRQRWLVKPWCTFDYRQREDLALDIGHQRDELSDIFGRTEGGALNTIPRTARPGRCTS